MGKREEEGLYALAAKDIFKLLREETSSSLRVSVALFEIYGAHAKIYFYTAIHPPSFLIYINQDIPYNNKTPVLDQTGPIRLHRAS